MNNHCSVFWACLAASAGVFSAGCSAAPGCGETSTCEVMAERADAGLSSEDAGPPSSPEDGSGGTAGVAGQPEETSQSDEVDAGAGSGGTGSVETENEDAGTVDGGSLENPSGGDAGGAPDLTTIILRNEEMPTTPPEFILVLVSSPSGERIDAKRTDAEGKVELSVPPGSTVTTLAESNYTEDGEPQSYTSIISWFDVPDVDPLYMNIWKITGDFVSEPRESVDVSVDLVSNRVAAEGDTGILDVACNGSYIISDDNQSTGFNSSYDLTGVHPCRGVSEIEIWGFARGGWAYGTYSPDPNVKPSITLMANSWQWDTNTLFVEEIPEGTERLRYGLRASMKAGSPGHYISKTVLLPLEQEVLPVEVPHATLHQVTASASLWIQEAPEIWAYANRSGSAVADLHWNASQDLARFEVLSAVSRTTPDRPALSWLMSETGKLGDYVEVQLDWRNVSWVAYLPPARQGTVQLPILPAGPDRFAPWPDDEIFLDGASLNDDLFLDGYAAMVSQPYDASQNYNQTYIGP